MTFTDLQKIDLILASQSPRRQFLLKELGIDFTVQKPEVDESFSPLLKAHEIPLYLSEKKARAFGLIETENTIVICADTIVWIDNSVLNKPCDRADAIRMLKMLSGKKHEVYTGVCLRSKEKIKSFYVLTSVYFKQLKEEEIIYYVDNYHPYDKAGAYGAQEWIGYIAVERIEGSYFNVMGLPLKELYEELIDF